MREVKIKKFEKQICSQLLVYSLCEVSLHSNKVKAVFQIEIQGWVESEKTQKIYRFFFWNTQWYM